MCYNSRYILWCTFICIDWFSEPDLFGLIFFLRHLRRIEARIKHGNSPADILDTRALLCGQLKPLVNSDVTIEHLRNSVEERFREPQNAEYRAFSTLQPWFTSNMHYFGLNSTARRCASEFWDRGILITSKWYLSWRSLISESIGRSLHGTCERSCCKYRAAKRLSETNQRNGSAAEHQPSLSEAMHSALPWGPKEPAYWPECEPSKPNKWLDLGRHPCQHFFKCRFSHPEAVLHQRNQQQEC